MPVTSEITSDYSGSLTPTSSAEESEEEEEIVRSRKVSESSSLLWTGTGSKRCPLIIFRSESLVTRDKKLKAIGEKYHLAYKMVKTESKLVRSVLTTYGFHEVHPNSADFNLMWMGAHLKPFSLRSLQEFQKVNHFPRSYEITRKDRLYKNVDRMAHTKGAKHFDFMPRSYLMPSEYQEFCAAYVKDKGPWIVKPIASSRGRGIYLINNPNQVPLEDNIMVCKYVSNPLLIDGFKFDIRVYIAVTSYDPLLIYLFEEGLTRFATVKYEKTNRHLKNQMMHLTNYSINKKSHDYVRCEDPEVEDYGNKWSMSAMLRYLKQEGVDTNALMMRIEAVIIKSIISAELPVATACRMFVPHRENCIELYGFDILVDENLKPWLLEGNLSPSLACDAPLDFKIKSSMVADFFSLAGFQCVDPMTRKQKKDPLRPANKRPVSASASKDSGSSNSGLTTEEARVLRMAKEQYQRRGGFLRIFPTPETWELYGSFLEYKSNLNLMLAQRLFPDRVKSRTTSGAYSSAVARMRSIASGHMIEGRNRVMSERFMQYERKLMSVESKKKKSNREVAKKKKKATPIGIDNKSVSQGRLRKVARDSASENSEDENDSDNSDSNQETNTVTTRPVSRSNAVRPSSRQSTQSQPKKTKNLSSNSQSSISDGKTKESRAVSARSRTDIVKSQKDELTGVRKATQRIYTYKPTSAVSKNITTTSQPKRNVQSRASERISDKDDSSSSESSDNDESAKASTARPTSVRSNTPRSKPPNKGPIDVLQVLKSGGNLGKVQARLAFSAYLSRVQHRLMAESESHVQELAESAGKQEEQMDLVLRFLKRAAGNLRQSFSVVVPSRRLTLPDRKRILAKQLGDFVHIYNKETDAMEQKTMLGLEKDSSLLNSYRLPGTGTLSVASSNLNNVVIKDSDFRTFVTAASETELEEVLTTYTHKNKSASVFLGASKPRTAREKTPMSTRETMATNARLQTRRMTGVDPLTPHQPLMHNNHLYQAEEHRESRFDAPPRRNQPLTTLRVRSPSPNPSIASGSSRNGVSSNPTNNNIAGSNNGMGGYPSTTNTATSSASYAPPPVATSSLQHAAYIYSAKLTPPTAVSNAVAKDKQRPASAKGVNPVASNSAAQLSQHLLGRPGSAAGHSLGGSLHYQTAANEEAIADALQRLAERQAARQYSATSQLQALTQHLSNLNLANMSSNRQSISVPTTLHSLAQRTSSLTDLASTGTTLDVGWSGDGNRSSTATGTRMQAANNLKNNQVLAQQSKELLQESKAKHQAMVAQILEAWGVRRVVDPTQVKQSANEQQFVYCPSPRGYISLVEKDKGGAKPKSNLLNALIEEAESMMSNISGPDNPSGSYTYVDSAANCEQTEECSSKDGCKGTMARMQQGENNKDKANSFLDDILDNTDDRVSVYNQFVKLHNQNNSNKTKNNSVKDVESLYDKLCGGSEPLLMYNSKSKRKRRSSKAEGVWNTYHNVNKQRNVSVSPRKGRSPLKERPKSPPRGKQNKTGKDKSPKGQKTSNSPRNSADVYKAAKNWGKNYESGSVKTFLSELKSLFEPEHLPYKRWRYQVAGTSAHRPWSAAASSRPKSASSEQKAHNMVNGQMVKPQNTSINVGKSQLGDSHTQMYQRPQSAMDHPSMKLQRPSSASMVHKAPSLSPPSSVMSAAKSTGASRPPQVPRPPDAPKPNSVIRKQLAPSGKMNRNGSHPQLNGLSPNPMKAIDDHNNFYNSLKYDTNTCATRVNDIEPDFNSMQDTDVNITSRPSSAKRPMWKP